MNQVTLSNRAWADLLLLGTIWGASFLAIRVTLDELTPLTSVLHRVGWAALVLWIVIWIRGLEVPRNPFIWFSFLVMGLLNNAIPFTLMAWGQLYIETGLTSIFNAATAIWGVLIAALFLADERLNVRKLAGVCIGFFGVAVAIGLEQMATFDIRSMAQLAVLAGTLSYAFAGVWAKTRLSSLHPQVATAGMLTGSSIVMAPLVLWIDGVPSLDLAPATWAGVFYISVVATACAYLLYYRVLSMAGSGNLMLVTLLVAPIAIVLGALFRDETLTPNAMAGFALLALGLIVLDGRVFRWFRG